MQMKTSKAESSWSWAQAKTADARGPGGDDRQSGWMRLRVRDRGAFAPAVGPLVFVPREIPEARNTELDIEGMV